MKHVSNDEYIHYCVQQNNVDDDNMRTNVTMSLLHIYIYICSILQTLHECLQYYKRAIDLLAIDLHYYYYYY